jgi:hypothetical protein
VRGQKAVTAYRRDSLPREARERSRVSRATLRRIAVDAKVGIIIQSIVYCKEKNTTLLFLVVSDPLPFRGYSEFLMPARDIAS